MKFYKIFIGFLIIIGIVIISNYSNVNGFLNKEKNLVETFQNQEQYTICIDPGHQLKGDSKTEPIGPNSGSYKMRVSSGTCGVATKKPEYELNLEASMVLKHILESRGYKVVMTRESHDVNISNMERAIFANEKNSDMVVRIHADGVDNSSTSGASILIPAESGQNTSKIFKKSYICATSVTEIMKNNGFKVNGIFERSDLTGFNWSTVPVILLEMGFMSNYTEDQNMSNPDYQKKMMTCVADGLDKYFEGNKKD